MAIASQQPVRNQREVSNAAGSCLLMKRVGSGSNWLGKEKYISSKKQYFGGDFGRLGPLPVDQISNSREMESRRAHACCQKATRTRRFHRVHGSDNAEVLRPAIGQVSQTPWPELPCGVWF